jgi:GNAT superfamily N-acetyltransferase
MSGTDRADRERWLELNRLGLAGFYRRTPPDSPEGLVVERDGLVAAVTPTVPERSVFNGVVYSDPEALRESLEELADIYERAGVRAWTVWVPEEDDATTELLETAGHHLDAEPRAMGRELDDIPAPGIDQIDWTAEGDIATMGLINDRAYGYEDGTFEAGMSDPERALHIYIARLDGELASTVVTFDVDDDTSVWCVATMPEARGKGLSTALMCQALHDARDRGRKTTTLQATKAGAPIYERLGYRDFGALQMWERRKAE